MEINKILLILVGLLFIANGVAVLVLNIRFRRAIKRIQGKIK